MVTRSLTAVEGSTAASVVVVLGYAAERIRGVLKPGRATVVHTDSFADGLSASLRAALATLPDEISGVVVCLADMPFVTSAHIDRLIAAHSTEPEDIIAAAHGGQRGNPVLWPRRFLPALMALQGDTGGRALLHQPGVRLQLVECGEGVLHDFDTPTRLDAFRTSGNNGLS